MLSHKWNATNLFKRDLNDDSDEANLTLTLTLTQANLTSDGIILQEKNQMMINLYPVLAEDNMLRISNVW